MKKSSFFLSILSFATGCLFILLSLFTGFSLNGYKSPLGSNISETMEHGNPVSEKVVLVVVDGLRHDVSCQMEFLNSLRANGGDFVSWTSIPSLSFPGWSALLTGATPEISGKILNWDMSELRAENLFSITKASGLENGLIGCPDWWVLLGDNITSGEKIEPSGDCVESDMRVKNAALRLVQNLPSFTLIHFLSVDEAGHLYGGNSEMYLERAREIDGYIKEIAERVDWNTTTLIVTSDHGHRDEGGHGGEELIARKSFAVFYGKGIKKANGEINQIDICPTISNLLGIKIPSLAQGRILFECLEQSIANEAIYACLLMKQRYFFASAYLEAIGIKFQLNSSYIEIARAEILAENYTKAEEISLSGLKEYNLIVEKARERKIFEAQMNTFVFSFLALIFSVWVAGVMVLRTRIKPGEIVFSALLVGIALLIYSLIFFLTEMAFSFSMFNEIGDVERTILLSFFVPGLIMLTTTTLYGYIKQRKSGTERLNVEAIGLGMYATLIVFLSLFLSINCVAYGFLFTHFVIHIDAFMRVFLGGFIGGGLLMYLGITLQLLEWLGQRKFKET
ncbi:MAG: alkaline phosphatase family protein [Thermoplasmata archaeon]